MRIETLSLQHQDLLTSLFNQLHPDISEYTFANLYLFREIHRYTVLFDPYRVWLTGMTRDGFSYLMPTFPLPSIPIEQIKPLLSYIDFLYPISEKWIKDLDPQLFTFSYHEFDSDYLFLAEKMRTYAGRHLSNKRNLVKQLLRQYKVEHFPLTLQRMSHAILILEKWHADFKGSEEKTDYSSALEAIHLFDTLRLNGRVFYLDGEPCAFIIGETLNSTQYLLHFAKACRRAKGLYQYLYQTTAQLLESSVLFINLEQDLGSPTIRQSKLSYLPDQMITKWRVKLKK
jgi:hypothetical protein